ncbi:MAG: ABC-F family ATP-binding cassette domain-containing protein [Candidatus Thermoplasmatota archaeon]|nr:ABC-F family ATP-binding cassette domain-containing protein [Candidatus Thermoplasmatota archaeon]
MSVILRVQGISKTLGGRVLFKDVSFDVSDNDCIGIIGPNGCGKTTLFSIILNTMRPDDGNVLYKPNLNMQYLEQTMIKYQSLSVDSYLNLKCSDSNIDSKIRETELALSEVDPYNVEKYEEILHRLQKLQSQKNKQKDNFLFPEISKIMEELNIDKIKSDAKISQLSGGEFQKLSISCVLARLRICDILLLDEPTNHLDIDTIEWFEQQIADFPGTIMIISHDRYLLDDLVDKILDFQGTSIEFFHSTYDEYEEQRQIRQKMRYQEYRKNLADIKRRESSIDKMSRRNRFDRQISSKLKRLEKLPKIENPLIKNYLLKIRFDQVFKSGKNISDGKEILKRFDDKIILDDASFEIFSGQKIGLIGPNGCGKTTFLKMLIGKEKLDKGKISLSRGVKWGYFDQGNISLNLEKTIIDEVRRNQTELSESEAKGLLGQFNFKDDDILKKVKQLSGGEQARLAFLKLIIQPYNFLILDEPTNHMDIDSKVAIESALRAYNGTVLVVSHDRRFLDNATTQTFVMANGKIMQYKGNYSTSKLQRQQQISDVTLEDTSVVYGLNLKKYVVKRAFTEWTTKKKFKVGDQIIIGDHNQKVFDWAIKTDRIVSKHDKNR